MKLFYEGFFFFSCSLMAGAQVWFQAHTTHFSKPVRGDAKWVNYNKIYCAVLDVWFSIHCWELQLVGANRGAYYVKPGSNCGFGANSQGQELTARAGMEKVDKKWEKKRTFYLAS